MPFPHVSLVTYVTYTYVAIRNTNFYKTTYCGWCKLRNAQCKEDLATDNYTTDSLLLNNKHFLAIPESLTRKWV